MKKLLILTSILFAASCSMDSPEAINKQIISYKNKVKTYETKISELEAKLESDSLNEKVEEGMVIVVKEMQSENFEHFILVRGKVEAIEEAMVSPEMNGQIKKIHVKEGQRVKKGQLMISLNTDLTEKAIKEVKTSLRLLVKLYDKQKELWDQKIGTEIQYLQAKTNKEAAEASLETLKEQLAMGKVKAPFDGIVEEIMAKTGELAMPGGRLLYLVNLKKLKVNSDISETYLNKIHENDMAEINFSASPDYELKLPITRIGSVIENKSRTFQVEINMDNLEEEIKPNQLASIKLQDFFSEIAFVVPSIIIKQDITGYYVYQAVNSDKGMLAQKVYLTPGRSSSDMTMIDSGVEEGMKIIIEGYNLVKNGTPVKIITD